MFQKSDESIEDCGKKVRTKLRKLNEASRSMATTEAERTILQAANEKLAISKFEQNIRNNTVRVLVSASTETSLDEAIQIALHKELMEGNKNIKSCTFCGLNNHTIESCRKKRNSNENRNKFQKQNKFFPRDGDKPNKNFNKEGNSASSSTSNEQPTEKFFNRNTSGNSFAKNNQRNVRKLDQNDSVSLQDALEEEEREKTHSSKNE